MMFKNKFRVLLTSALLGCASLFSSAAVAAGVLVKDGEKVAFLGDSITAYGWGYPGGYVRLVVDGLAKQGIRIAAVPAGIGGHKSNDMLARLQNDVLSHKPDWMTLSCGVNDVWHGAKGVDLPSYQKNITAIVDQAQAHGVKVVILTPTVINEEPNANNTKLEPYNDFLRELAKERGLPLADLNALFQEFLAPRKPAKNARFLTVDGVHMNPEGNALMAKGVLQAFGVSPADVAKIERDWLMQKDTAMLGNYSFDARPRLGITLGQFRAIAKLAEKHNVSSTDMGVSLWLRIFSETIQAHAGDPVLNADKIKKEAEGIFSERLERLQPSS
jgi:lysophospholipase L1-like esterase